MRPMSLLESRESSGEISLKDLFSGNKELVGKSDIDASKLAFLACRGGWPMSVKLTGLSALLQARDYVDSVAESELSLADNTRRDEYRLKAVSQVICSSSRKPSRSALRFKETFLQMPKYLIKLFMNT